MFLKQKVRNKYILIRKKKYFQVNQDFFKPLINLIYKNKKKKISLYYPSNFEVDTIELFKILKKNKSISTMLPIISFTALISRLLGHAPLLKSAQVPTIIIKLIL